MAVGVPAEVVVAVETSFRVFARHDVGRQVVSPASPVRALFAGDGVSLHATVAIRQRVGYVDTGFCLRTSILVTQPDAAAAVGPFPGSSRRGSEVDGADGGDGEEK